MDEAYGLPLVTADTVYDTLAQMGVVAWEKLRVVNLDEYRKWKLTPRELEELEKYSPKGEVALFRKPDGELYNAFRSRLRNAITVFNLIPNPRGEEDLTIITGEWKQGTEEVVLHYPAGVPNNDDKQSDDPLAACAMRIFFEETGIEAEKVVPLSEKLVGAQTRNTTGAFQHFLGIPKLPIEQKNPPRTHESLYTKAVIMPITEWIELIHRGEVYEECALGATLQGLLYLNRIAILDMTLTKSLASLTSAEPT